MWRSDSTKILDDRFRAVVDGIVAAAPTAPLPPTGAHELPLGMDIRAPSAR